MITGMTIRPATLLLTLGLMLAVAALVFGFAPVSRSGESCGSPWLSNGDVVAFGNYNDCEAARSDRETLSLAFSGPAVICLAVGVGMSIATRRPK